MGMGAWGAWVQGIMGEGCVGAGAWVNGRTYFPVNVNPHLIATQVDELVKVDQQVAAHAATLAYKEHRSLVASSQGHSSQVTSRRVGR